MTKAEAALAAKKLTPKTVEVVKFLGKESYTKAEDIKAKFPRWGHAKKALTTRGWIKYSKTADSYGLNGDGKKVLHALG
jgi:hypothetical protein